MTPGEKIGRENNCLFRMTNQQLMATRFRVAILLTTFPPNGRISSWLQSNSKENP